MREIKFKFLMENGEVTKPYYLKELIDSDAYINIECEYSCKIKQELQYTGLKDKNDVEIYEGDIIELICNESGCVLTGKYICLFKDGCFKFKENGSDWVGTISDSNIKVIGNIYENPELLKGE